ncbi:hypothetical protein [Hymenobacter bucti]|uniref:Uncharacterized protein n=1 Tax=Hymenobacter bucti TaxID=1844114 RepID=A0ABW4QYI1_9BACT
MENRKSTRWPGAGREPAGEARRRYLPGRKRPMGLGRGPAPSAFTQQLFKLYFPYES